MSNWTDIAALPELSERSLVRLSGLLPMDVPKGTVLFQPGEAVKGFVIMLEGRVDVFLTGPTGREILLYAVEPGQSCVQSTLGLMGGEDYSGEAITRGPARLVLVPKEMFLTLMGEDDGFRDFVFRAFAKRMQTMMHLLEKVAFTRVEARLAQILLERCEAGVLTATHAEIAVMIGSAREVVSRRLDALAKRGILHLERGRVEIRDFETLEVLAETD
ncbi:Crp/Fnr family transcriptional regulator [Tropicibacter sp. R15_0]|uniref:Crp/Fnr family transcriptional regulator n=1 Tax=Tropicibacter sp. R15_0 TaxID=2821101 RepID=UPI001ADAE9F4|nr:Crp/Fnr family transcriptional regulator [Tropicibacter sp. R15_0]MBO9464897.1 Crp/Fnr family transcriptional regulator [Tropicibacter sp. R15_0]